ncbi:MAG: 30S ribosomal protein S8 [Aeropyrum sp.]|nr:30S ribosomal protein S8 [Aeropyrum sp.]MCE4616493.1 30S ribosomal protein S8 [Aeropyrum sp.]
MVMLDTLANAMATIKNAEMRGKSEAIIMPASKLIASVLRVLESEGYIGGFEYIDDGRWGKFRVTLLGRINDIGVIKPRMPVKYTELAKMPEHLRKYLASRDIGTLIISTPQGVMTHREALKRKIGGIVIAYVY